MAPGIEDMRTPLGEILYLDNHLRGTLSGFMMPNFVVDLPGGGGKRLVSTYESYDEEIGVATYRAPGLPNEKGTKLYFYYDPKVEVSKPKDQGQNHDVQLAARNLIAAPAEQYAAA
jgi:lysine 2,3-aminomutase